MTHLRAALHIDFETRSACELKSAGLDNYAKHPTTDVWCLAYAFDDGPVDLIRHEHLGMAEMLHGELLDHVRAGGVILAHNAAFELAIWNEVMVKLYGWPPLAVEQCRCTMSMGYAMGLPGKLEKLAPALNVTSQKDMVGARVMLQYAKPKEILPPTIPDGWPIVMWHDDPAKIEKLYAYCRNDVVVERECAARMMPLSDDEQALWVLDQKINGRGIAVDLPSVRAAQSLVMAEKQALDSEIRVVTDGVVSGGTDLAQMKTWIKYRETVPAEAGAAKFNKWVKFKGLGGGGLAKADILALLERDDLPADVRRVLVLRQESGKSSTSKLDGMADRVSRDGRIRGTMQYHGAGPGRWAGRGIQVHNMPRGKLKPHEVEGAIALFHDRAALDMLYGAPLDVLSSCLRGMLVASAEKEFIVCDYSNIEGRVMAWLAGEAWKLDAFRAFDAGTGPDLYVLSYSRAFGEIIEAITKDQRQVGKVMELALQFQGGVGAFQTMARGYGVDVSDERADELKHLWRAAHPAIVAYWYALDDAAIEAVKHPGRKVVISTTNARITFLRNGSFLFCQLPSGRVNVYPFPSIKPNQFDRDAVFYWNQNQTTNRWEETSGYGGVWGNHITQGTARDILVCGIRNLERNGFPVVMHVHDEAVCETPAGLKSVEQAEFLMCQLPSWAAGLPIAAEGWSGRRYRKA